MHRAVILDEGEPSVRPRPRRFSLLKAIVMPWHGARMFEYRARAAARREGCAFIHFGVDCIIHLPEASYGVPWRDVQVESDGPLWRIRAAGMELSVVDAYLAAWERRRLEY